MGRLEPGGGWGGEAGPLCWVTLLYVWQKPTQHPEAIILQIMVFNTFESVLMRWMKLEPIIQSEVSQKEKHQYSILTHIYGI